MAVVPASRRRALLGRIVGVGVAFGLVAAACSGTNHAVVPSTADGASSNGGAPAPAPVSDQAGAEPGFAYEWQRLPLGAGGWVPGLVIHAGSGAKYARTDVGGAYRYDDATGTWQQMLLATTVPGADPTHDDYAVESIALSASDPLVVLVSVGGDENPGASDPLPVTGRVLRSADGGHTWAASSTSFFINGNQALRQRSERLVIDPGNARHVLFGTRRQGLWESTDAGASFHQVPTAQVPLGTPSAPDQDHGGVTFVSFDPTTSARAYAGVQGAGVFRSDDSGITWRKILTLADGKQGPFEGTFADSRLLIAVNTIDGDTAGVLKLYNPADGTLTDITPSRRASAWSAAIDPTNPLRMVAAGDAVSDGALFVTVDGAKTWSSLDISIEANEIPWLGRTDLENYMSIGRLVFDPKQPGRLWFAEGMGIWRTDDLAAAQPPSAVVWHLDSRGIEELVVADVIIPPGHPPISVVADRQGMQSTSLTAYPTAPLVDKRFAGGTDLDYSGRNPNSLVWIGAEYNIYWDDRRVARAAISSDGGSTWKELPNLTKNMFGGNVAVSATDPNNIVWLPSYFINPFEYSDRGKGIFVTTNGGQSWKNLTVDGKNNFHRLMWWLSRQALVSDKVAGGVFYLQNDTQEFYVSTDGGLHWTKAAHSVPCAEFNACFVYGQLVASPNKASELWSSAGDSGLYRSRDRGGTPWEKLPGIATVRAFGLGAPLAPGGPNVVYVYGTANGDPKFGIWRSADDGRTWQLIGRVPLDLYAKITTINGDPDHPGRVYVGFGGNGVVYGEDPAHSGS